MSEISLLPFPLQTPRLLLREMGRADTDQLQQYHQDAEFRKYEDPDDIQGEIFADLMEYLLSERWHMPRRAFYLAITRIDAPALALGSIFVAIEDSDMGEGEIGYVLGRPHWGQGYVTESARAMLQFAFETLRLNRIYAECHSENIASIRVLEKIGMRHENTLEKDQFMGGRWYDTWVFAIHKPEWLALQPDGSHCK